MKISIGELEKLTGLSRTALRYYDTEGLIEPERLENGYRAYCGEDVMSLVQIRQLNALGVGLSELPGSRNRRRCADVLSALVAQEQSIEEEIEDLYQKLSRLRLHVDAYQRCAGSGTVIEEGRMPGAYRIYYSTPKKDHPRTAEIFRRWMNHVPETYSAIRIPQKALLLPMDESCAADTGIGLLSGAFKRFNETYEPPIEYTPPCRCIGGMIETPDLSAIPRAALEPFRQYIEAHALIPLGDMYGWVVYTPADRQAEPFRISLRVGVH